MAGSYNHAVAGDGRLLSNERFVGMIENLGDAFEMAEEMYGMIWWLARNLSDSRGVPASVLVEFARQDYKLGLEASPGVGGEDAIDDED